MASSSSFRSPSLSTRSAEKWTYEVFLSFRGEDTRKNFVDHLYAALDQRGVVTFKDDEKLRWGESIGPELIKAIEESRCAIVVFSKNYANSSWCLGELAKIMECKVQRGQKVFPVFYDVDPSDVRKQKGSFETAFQQHEEKYKQEMDKVRKWREYLTAAANLSGCDVAKAANGREAECIKRVVLEILSHRKPYFVDQKLVGMESRVQELISLLDKGSKDVRRIGIWGMGGAGKTTIARALFRRISDEFEGSSFLQDVRANSSTDEALKLLQEKLLSEILMDKHVRLRDCNDGAGEIQRRLGRKKVLLVLDDVDHDKQLEFLAGSEEWFGPGSRIIATTRDEHLLYEFIIYKQELLNLAEATELFCRHAFKGDCPEEGFEKISSDVVSYAGCLPLALKVLGCHLRGRELVFWESDMNVLRKIGNKEIHGILRLTFDGLDDLQKNIFLDIACFFKGEKSDSITQALDCCGFEPIIGIQVLIEKSLVTIDSNLRFQMHDLIQDMGQQIAQASRLWHGDEFSKLLMTNMDLPLCCGGGGVFKLWQKRQEGSSDAVEVIVDLKHLKSRLNAQFFSSMKKLRILYVRGKFTSRKPKYLPDELKWLSWDHYPFHSLSLSTTTSRHKLAGLEMISSRIRQLQLGQSVLYNLKIINLSNSWSLKSFADISGAPNLERLNLSGCVFLVEIHQSVGILKRLAYLDLNGCQMLEIFPSSIHMESLETLILSGCSSLKRFPEILGEMRRLSKLDLSFCSGLKELPSSFRLLTGLTFLDLHWCPLQSLPNSIFELKQLQEFRLQVDASRGVPSYVNELQEVLTSSVSTLVLSGDTNDLFRESVPIQAFTCFTSLRSLCITGTLFREDNFPSDLHNAWPLLEELDLEGNLFTRLPASICHLSHLKILKLSRCSKLEEITELPPSIQVLRVEYCPCFKKIDDLSNRYKWLYKISFVDCPKLRESNGESQSYLANLLRKSFIQRCAAANHRLNINVVGRSIPDWFKDQQLGNKIELKLPPSWHTAIKGIALCCVFPKGVSYVINIKFKFEDTKDLVDVNQSEYAVRGDELRVWMGYIPFDYFQQMYDDVSQLKGYLVIQGTLSFDDVALVCGGCIIYKEEVELEHIPNIQHIVQDCGKLKPSGFVEDSVMWMEIYFRTRTFMLTDFHSATAVDVVMNDEYSGSSRTLLIRI